MPFSFDAGASEEAITAIAKGNGKESSPVDANVKKIVIPGWAGSATDWAGQSGVSYNADLNWPVPSALQSLSGLSFLNGDWGVIPSAESSLKLNANSSTSPASGDLSGGLEAKFAGRGFNLPLSGTNTTTLSCDDLTMTGDAQLDFLNPRWTDTIGLADLVPGLEILACGASQILCDGVRSLSFIKASAAGFLAGNGSYEGQAGASKISWTGGSISGDISASVSLNAFPSILDKIVSASVSASGSGCIELGVVPDIQVDTLGAEVKAKASASVFSKGVQSEKTWQLGDVCSSSSPVLSPITPAESLSADAFEAPGDGQVELVFNDSPTSSHLAAAVWREATVAEERPSGSISARIFNGSVWSAPITITDDTPADISPTVTFDSNGNLVIVYARNPFAAALPADLTQVDAFANGLDLFYAVIDPDTESISAAGQLTTSSLADTSPVLRRDSTGIIHLFWQRSTGTDLFGSTASPVSIHTRSWDGTNWDTEQTVLASVVQHFGWYPAVWNANEQIIALILDQDDNMETATDRELYTSRKILGVWQALVRATNDAVEDHSPLITFADKDNPILLWVGNAEIKALPGNLSASPISVTEAGNTVSLEFGKGEIYFDGALHLMWQDATRLMHLSNNDPLGNDSWHLDALVENGESNTVLDMVATSVNQLMLGHQQRDITDTGDMAENAIVTVLTISDPHTEMTDESLCFPIVADSSTTVVCL